MSTPSKKVGTLYSLLEYYRTLPCLISASYGNNAISLSDSSPDDKTDDLLKMNIYKQLYSEIPMFVSTDGKTVLHDSNSISYFLANDQLRGGEILKSQCQVLEWTHFAERELVPLVESCAFIKPSEDSKDKPSDKNKSCKLEQTTLIKSRAEVLKLLNHLNNYLKSNTFFVNDRITLADISIFSNCFLLFQLTAMKDDVLPFKHLLRWFNTIKNQPEVIAPLGDHVAKFEFFKLNTFSAICNSDRPEKTCLKEQPTSVTTDKPEDAAPKSKNPLASLPKGTFSIDDFKRVYCNQDTEKVALPYLWEHFDPEHYSFWFCSYKFPKELKLTFMTSNLISGMFQRLDSLRNHAFASMCIFGENNNNTIAGIWMWRGQDLAFELYDDWRVDYESYDWEKLDISKPDKKELINEYLNWTVKAYSDKEFKEGKIFK